MMFLPNISMRFGWRLEPRLERRVLAALAALALALAVACGSSATSAPVVVPTAQPVDPNAISTILATTVLEVGRQRVAFLLQTSHALVTVPSVSVTPVFLEGDTAGETVEAEYHPWPYGVRGAYSTDMTFDQAGRWRLDIAVDGSDVSGLAQVEVDVGESAPVPSLGAVGPLSENKTLNSVPAIELLTTDYSPDPDLYQMTIKDAVASPLPSVVVFASPAFCTTPTCGPQVDTVSELKDLHKGQANFIHVEIYDNPAEIQGDLDRAEISPVIDEWGITAIPDWFNESWTFVMDSEGTIQGRFEGFATLEELDASLVSVLR